MESLVTVLSCYGIRDIENVANMLDIWLSRMS